MRELLAAASWVTLTVALAVLAVVWPPLGTVLIILGASGMAFIALLLGEGVVQDVRSIIRMRRYERQRAAWLARRKRPEASGE